VRTASAARGHRALRALPPPWVLLLLLLLLLLLR